jgi:ABC-type nitrate/sulfonate/bicarbonate transport system permease component
MSDTAAPIGVSSADLEAGAQRRRRQRARRDRIGSLIYPLGMVVALLLVWQAAAYVFAIPPYLLPSPSEIAYAMDVNSSV